MYVYTFTVTPITLKAFQAATHVRSFSVGTQSLRVTLVGFRIHTFVHIYKNGTFFYYDLKCYLKSILAGKVRLCVHHAG